MENNGKNQLPLPPNSKPPPLQSSYIENIRDKLHNHIESVADLKSHPLPATTIKRIMKQDPEVKMISKDAPHVLAKACELFILDLTMRSWSNADEKNRRILQKSHVSNAIARNAAFDFLVDVVPREEPVVLAANVLPGENPLNAAVSGFAVMPPPGGVGEVEEVVIGTPVVDNPFYYYPPGMAVGTPVNSDVPPPQPWDGASTSGDKEDTAGGSGGSGGVN